MAHKIIRGDISGIRRNFDRKKKFKENSWKTWT